MRASTLLVPFGLVLAVGCSSDGDPSTPSDGGTDAALALDASDGAAEASASDGGDAAPGDASDGAAPKSCGPTADIFCDDFESYPAGAITAGAKWKADVAGGAFTIDTATKKAGQKSLKATVTGNGRALANITGFTAPNNSFYGRMHVWVKAFPTAPQYAHWTMFEVAGSGPDRIRPIGGQYIPNQGTERLWGTGSDGGPTGDWTRWSTTAPAESGKWVCLEWQVKAANDEMHVWIDGAAKPALDVSTKNHGGNAVDLTFPTFTKAWFGWWLYQANPTPAQFEIWFDDVALGTTRQGC
jgi:hypothetical protein